MRAVDGVGIVGYGAYVPIYRIAQSEFDRVWKGKQAGSRSEENAVPGLDEDATTMAIEAAQNALARAGVDPDLVGAIWVGATTKPYAVKPAATTVAEALGLTPDVNAADWEFSSGSGAHAMEAAIGFVTSSMTSYALVVGSDTQQGRPGDEMEHTAGAGAAGILVGPGEEALALFEATYCYTTDMPDIFRRHGTPHLEQGDRFTGEPAFFRHSQAAAQRLLAALGRTPGDYRYFVCHQPNAKFPARLAKRLGFTREQLQPGLLVTRIGNPFSASSMLGLAAVLDQAQPGERVLFVSYGSGAGSIAFSLITTERIANGRERVPSIAQYVMRRQTIDYATYVRHTGWLGLPAADRA